jgi:hypothetical protein
MIRKTKIENKIEVAFISDMLSENDRNIANSDIENYMMIGPNATDTFSREISAH